MAVGRGEVYGLLHRYLVFDIPDDAAAAFFDIEMRGRDAVPFASLTRSATSVGSLYAATGC